MELIKDLKKNDKLIKAAIKKHGYAAEHNYHHFLYSETKEDKNIFINFNGKGILTQLYKEKEWHMFAEVLAPKRERLKLFFRFVDHALEDEKCKKVVVEVTKEFMKEIKSLGNFTQLF